MKTVYVFLILTVLSALSSAQPSRLSYAQPSALSLVRPGFFKSDLRVKRQAVLVNGSCGKMRAYLIRGCIPCERFEEITGKNCPSDPKYKQTHIHKQENKRQRKHRVQRRKHLHRSLKKTRHI